MITSCVKNGLVMVVILLFVGVAVQPCVATVQPEEEIDVEPDINYAKGLVAQLQVVINDLLQEYGHIPIIRTLGNMIYNILVIIWRIFYCTWLVVAMILCSATIVFLTLFTIYPPMYYILWLLAYIIYFGMYCFPSFKLNQNLLLNSFTKKNSIDIFDISTLRGLKEESDVVSECPCMQQ